MKLLKFILVLICAALVSYATVQLSSKDTEADPQKETTYARVMRTGKLRCGYFVYAPAIIPDEAAGAFSGFMADYAQAVADALELELVWQQEAQFSTYLQDIENGRFDFECSGGWPNAMRGKHVDYTLPIAYLPLYAYTRSGDTRFDDNLEAINSPEVRYVAPDGETSSLIRLQRFPDSTLVSLPQSVPFTDIPLNVQTGKADVAVIDVTTAVPYMNANPGALRQVKSEPLRLIQLNFTVPRGDVEFKEMLNTATRELMYDGVIDRILDKYDPDGALLLRPAQSYRQPK